VQHVTSYPGSAGWYENERNCNKEDTGFTTLARSHLTSEKLSKEMKKLMPKEKQDIVIGFPKTGVFKIWSSLKINIKFCLFYTHIKML
jgi:hypothetical protein